MTFGAPAGELENFAVLLAVLYVAHGFEVIKSFFLKVFLSLLPLHASVFFLMPSIFGLRCLIRSQ